MVAITARVAIDWRCRHTWRRASKNTAWCLLGCAIGDFGTIAFFQFTGIAWPTMAIMVLAIANGLLTSIARGVRAHHWRFGDMPPVEGLTRRDVAGIVAYVRELQHANGIR